MAIGRKLLVYSDGGAPRRHPYASYAAYEVDPEVDYKKDYEAHAKLSCRMLYEPVVHVSRQPLFPKRMSNMEAEAKALRLAVCWAGVHNREHGPFDQVEFCSDSKSLVEGLAQGKRSSVGMVRNDVQFIEANIRRNLKNVEIRFTWIPGDVMKTSIINH